MNILLNWFYLSKLILQWILLTELLDFETKTSIVLDVLVLCWFVTNSIVAIHKINFAAYFRKKKASIYTFTNLFL